VIVHQIAHFDPARLAARPSTGARAGRPARNMTLPSYLASRRSSGLKLVAVPRLRGRLSGGRYADRTYRRAHAWPRGRTLLPCGGARLGRRRPQTGAGLPGFRRCEMQRQRLPQFADARGFLAGGELSHAEMKAVHRRLRRRLHALLQDR